MTRSPLTGRANAALAGLLATVTVLALGELAAGLVDAWYSPIQAVGDTVIEFTPRPVKDFAIDVFGTNDKLALIIGTLIITLIYGTVLGVIGRTKLTVASVGIALFGVIGIAASVFQDDIAAAVPSLLAMVVGVPLLGYLLRLAPAPAGAASDAADVPAAQATPAAGPTEGVPAPPSATTDDGDLVSAGTAPSDEVSSGDRRRFLAVTGGLTVASAAAVATGRSLINARGAAVDDAREAIASQIGQTAPPASGDPTGSATEQALRPLGVVDDPLAPVPDGVMVSVDGMTPFVTPDEDFYRIDIALQVPQIDPNSWTLRLGGMVDNELEFTYEELLRRDDLIEADITLTCVSNEVGGTLMSSGRWTGVPLTNLLEEAGVQSGADQFVGKDGDDFSTGFPLAELEDGRPAMLALLYNGEPLSAERGFPARTIVPGLYGYVSATKWITEIEVTTFDAFDQYWVERGWDAEAPIKLMSRIDVPAPLERKPAGMVAVAGVAWDQTVGIERVELRVNDGEWMECQLADELNENTWRQWMMPLQLDEPGNYRLSVRATNKDGEVQTEERQPPFPNGASGWMTLLLTVT